MMKFNLVSSLVDSCFELSQYFSAHLIFFFYNVNTTHQDAFVHVAVVVAQVHTDPDDAGVGPLAVIHGQARHGDGAFVMGGQVRVGLGGGGSS